MFAAWLRDLARRPAPTWKSRRCKAIKANHCVSIQKAFFTTVLTNFKHVDAFLEPETHKNSITFHPYQGIFEECCYLSNNFPY